MTGELPISARISEAIAAFRRGELARARALAQAQVDAERGPPDAFHLLGLIDCREGRMESGIRHLGAAVQAQPDNIAFRLMLARAFMDAARPREALEAAMAPRETSPAALALWHVRAEAAQAAADHPAAAEAWAVVSAARPDDWRVWANYGDSLAGLERWPDAANALRRAYGLNSAELSIQQNLVSALIKAGFHSEAADQLRITLEFWPDDPVIRLTLARLLADLGRPEESMAEFEKAGEAADRKAAGDNRLIRLALPDWGKGARTCSEADLRALRELAALLERTNRTDALRDVLADAEVVGIDRGQIGIPAAAIALRDGDAAEAKRLLEAAGPKLDPVRWHRLMARVLDAMGDPAGAFAEAAAMNRSMPEFDDWVRKGASYSRRVRGLAATVTPSWAARVSPVPPGPRPSPVFLVGFPRSGTTLLDTFLMGHPDTQVLEEVHLLGAAEAVLGNAAHLPDRSPAQSEQARRAYFAELDRHVDRDFAGLVVDKMPLNMLGLPSIHALFPDAKIIFAQRHPCDCALSAFMQSFALNEPMACFLTIEGTAEFYDAAMTLFTVSRESLPISIHTIVYEDLVADPEAALRPLIDFIGLEWRPELLDHRATARTRGAIITPSYDQVIQPLSKRPSGRWRRYEAELAPALPLLLPWAERMGYEA